MTFVQDATHLSTLLLAHNVLHNNVVQCMLHYKMHPMEPMGCIQLRIACTMRILLNNVWLDNMCLDTWFNILAQHHAGVILRIQQNLASLVTYRLGVHP